MTSNKLKIIACITMLIDHIGYILLPQFTVLRYIGRIAMPLFAFLIAEGCLHTKNRLKYFLQIFILAVICQAFYIGEEIISGNFQGLYLNILFTFSLSLVSGFAVLYFRSALTDRPTKILKALLFLLGAVILVLGLTVAAEKMLPFYYYIDYGLCGVLLPVSALLFDRLSIRKLSFSAMLFIYCLVDSQTLPYCWFALLSLPLIFAYNGKLGTKKLKYLFYLFYPLHLAALYGISLII